MLKPLWESIEFSAFGSAIASSEWMFPTIETIHVFAIVTVIGAIAIMDLRLLGLASRSRTVQAMERDTVPLTWIAFAVAVITGLLLFASKASSYVANPYFLAKLALLALAGMNMWVFHKVFAKDIANWGRPGVATPAAAKLSGALSFAFWILIPLCGRIVGFTLGVYY